jgi:hypothetical protein
MKKTNEISRRNQLNLNLPAEIAIHKAIQEVELIGADIRLTRAVILLSEARNLVSDFLDDNLVQCQCGKYIEVETAIMDEEGCWTCPECYKEMTKQYL